jgi:hypothetical protein
MFKLQSRDRDLLLTILAVGVTVGMMLLLICTLGELHGLISTVIILIGQISFLTMRVVALEREIRVPRETPKPTEVSAKTDHL